MGKCSSIGSSMYVFDLHDSDFIGKAQFEKVYKIWKQTKVIES